MIAVGGGNVNPWVGVVTGLILAVVIAVMPVSASKERYPSYSERKKWGMVAVMLGIAAFFFAFTR